MNKTLFIIVCIMALITVIIYTFVASAIHKKELCQKSPYYFCDTNWYCCKAGDDGCALKMTSANSFKISDQFYNTSSGNPSGQTPLQCADPSVDTGKNYYQACVQPVQEFVKYKLPSDTADLACLYQGPTCPAGLQTIFNRSPNPITITPGQCCYKQVDFQTTPDGSAPNAPNPYPQASAIGGWTTQGNYGTYYSSSPNFVFPQGSSGADTRLNTCKNSLFGTTALKYSGC